MDKEITEEVSQEVNSDILENYSFAEKIKKDTVSSGFAWDDREQLFYGRYKSPEENKKIKSLYSTGELLSLVIDSSCRIMAQMPTGRFCNIDDPNIGKVIAANLTFHEYIIPNANTGGNFFTKMRQANMYSKVYGKMPAFVDYIVSKKYTGPDVVLIHPRRFMPQPGKYSIADMDWCFVDVPVTKEWLEERSKNHPEIWNPDLIAELAPTSIDQSTLSTEERKGIQDKKNIVLRNYFTRQGDWTLYEVSSKKKIFEQRDYWPGIPMTEKGTIPVLDRYWDICDFERGEMPQKTIDSLFRKYLAAIDKSIDPTTILDPESMVMTSVNVNNKFWFAKNGKTNEPRVLENSPQGLATFQSTYQIIKANLISLGAQTDTSIPSGIDVGLGKTPEALKKQGAREGARDIWDRYMQEKFFEDTANMMMAVASKRGMGDIKIIEIESALKKIKSAYPEKDIEIFKQGTIGKDYLASLNVKYKVDPGSTSKKDDSAERILNLLTMIQKNPAIQQDIAASGKKVNWGEAIKRLAIEDGIQDWDKIIVDATNPESVKGIGDEEGTTISEDGAEENLGIMNDVEGVMPINQQ